METIPSYQQVLLTPDSFKDRTIIKPPNIVAKHAKFDSLQQFILTYSAKTTPQNVVLVVPEATSQEKLMTSSPSPSKRRSSLSNDRWAGAAFSNSPASESLPRPSFEISPIKGSGASVAPESNPPSSKMQNMTTEHVQNTSPRSKSVGFSKSPQKMGTKSNSQKDKRISPPSSNKKQNLSKKGNDFVTNQASSKKDALNDPSFPTQTSAHIAMPQPISIKASHPEVRHHSPPTSDSQNQLEQLSSYLKDVLKIGFAPEL